MKYHWSPPAPLPRFPIWTWPILLVAVGLALAGIVRLLRPQMDERIYARFRTLPQAQFLPADAPDGPLKSACAAYNVKAYSKALQLFRQDTQSRYTVERQLYSGICLLELNDTKAAGAQLEALLRANPESPLRDEMLFYQGLCHLRAHRRGACREALLQVTPGSPRQTAIHHVLDKIR